MKSIIDILVEKEDLLHGKGVSLTIIKETENELGLNFSDEYKEYLNRFGIVAYEGHELTGLSKSERTNVANVTMKNKSCNSLIPVDWYVIEELNIENIVIWQSCSGEIYQTYLDKKCKKICNSLSEYIQEW